MIIRVRTGLAPACVACASLAIGAWTAKAETAVGASPAAYQQQDGDRWRDYRDDRRAWQPRPPQWSYGYRGRYEPWDPPRWGAYGGYRYDGGPRYGDGTRYDGGYRRRSGRAYRDDGYGGRYGGRSYSRPYTSYRYGTYPHDLPYSGRRGDWIGPRWGWREL